MLFPFPIIGLIFLAFINPNHETCFMIISLFFFVDIDCDTSLDTLLERSQIKDYNDSTAIEFVYS
jgi:hypothetical protein